MSGQQKRGFRLPWGAEREGAEASDAADDQGTLDSAPAAVGEDPGDGPFRRAESPPALTMDAAPAASDVVDENAEGEMIDTEDMQERIARAAGDGVWSTDDTAEGGSASKPASTSSVAAKAKRENPLVAGLVKAMREAALASRAETTTRLQAEAASRIETIRAESTEEATTLRKRVDEDIAGIREWSKLEMARIRAETEHRIEERRADAINENQQHLDSVEQLVEQVQSTVASFESDMDRFFDRLLAENDPARLATLAEQAPEPPDLTGELPKSSAWTKQSSAAEADEATTNEAAAAADDVTEATAEAVDAEQATTTEATSADLPADALEAAAAAEAEAEATEGLDLSNGEAWPAAVLAAASRRTDSENAPAESGDGTSSKLVVSGLTSVAGISAFKGAVGGLSGIRSVSVSTGERGVFIFTINHEPETDIAAALSSLTNFSVRVTESSDDSVSVTAHEPAAE